MTQPAGFTTPAIRQQLPVKILTPTFYLSPMTLGKDMQAPLQLSLSPNPNLNLPRTLTSGDPSKLLISADPNIPGSSSVTSFAGPIYVQALDSQGTVTLNASIPTFNDASTTVRLLPSGIGLSPESLLSNGQYSTTTQSPKTRILAGFYSVDQTGNVTLSILRAGLGPVMANVTSSNPAVGSIAGSPVRISTDGTQSSVDFTPLSVGATTVSVTQPAGFIDPHGLGAVTFNVTPPGLLANNVVIAKDTFVNADASLQQNVTPPTVNVAVTLTSSDPSRVLLSPDTATAPAASITRMLIAGRSNLGGFYVHALGNSGTVPIRITAPGFADASMNVTLADLAFLFDAATTQNGTPLRAVIQAGLKPRVFGRLYSLPRAQSATRVFRS